MPIARACLLASLIASPVALSPALADEPPARRDAATPGPRLPRDDLLVYRGADGKPHPVRTVDDWLKRRAEVFAGMRAVMGPWPGPEKRCPLDPKVEEEIDCGTYVRRFVTYASE